MVSIGHRHKQLQIFQPHILAVSLEPSFELVCVEDAVEIFIEESEGFDQLGVFLACNLFLFAGCWGRYLVMSVTN